MGSDREGEVDVRQQSFVSRFALNVYVKRVRNLLRQARNVTGPEQDTFIARANQIINRHKLKKEDVGSIEDGTVEISLGVWNERYHWGIVLAGSIARTKDCVARWKGKELFIWGHETDAERCSVMFREMVIQASTMYNPPSPNQIRQFRVSDLLGVKGFQDLYFPVPLATTEQANVENDKLRIACAELFYSRFAEVVSQRLNKQYEGPQQIPAPPSRHVPIDLKDSAKRIKDGLEGQTESLTRIHEAATTAGNRVVLTSPRALLPAWENVEEIRQEAREAKQEQERFMPFRLSDKTGPRDTKVTF